MLYVTDAHPLFSGKVKMLEPEEVDAHQLLAESLLRLRTPVLTEALEVSRIAMAIVLQVNFQVAQGIDPLFISADSSSHSKQSKVYRDRVINPQSASIIADVLAVAGIAAGDWSTITSHRTE